MDKIDIQEERDFLLRKAALCNEEAAEDGLHAGAADGCHEFSTVIRSERPDFYRTAVAQQFNHRIFCCFHHDRDNPGLLDLSRNYTAGILILAASGPALGSWLAAALV